MSSLKWCHYDGWFIPAQIAGTHHPREFTHLQILIVLFDNQHWKAQNDKSRLFYARYVLAQFQAFVICLIRKYFSTQPSLFFCCYYTPTFVVSLWCGDLKMYSSFLFWHHSESVGQRCCLIPTSFCWSAILKFGYNTDIYQVLGTPVTEPK